MSENSLFLDLNVKLPDDIEACKKAGDFNLAVKLIDSLLNSDLKDEHLRNSLILQKEVIKRLDREYEIPFVEAVEIIKKKIEDFTAEDLEKYMYEKRFSWIFKNHEIYVFNRFEGCLEKYEDYRSRLKDYRKVEVENTARNRLVRRIKKDRHIEEKIRITHSVKIKDEYFKKDMNVTVHLPVAKLCEHQKDIIIEKCIGANPTISDEKNTYRTVCFKEKMEENHPFKVTYSYTSYYDYIDLENKKGEECDINEYLDEKYPHIVFTDHLKKLSNSITEGINDPLAKARAIYDYITLNMNYSFQPVYFVRDNIPEYTTTFFRGDCGFFALTFVTLCRIAGIPAYFESGLAVNGNDVGAHDWARFYVKPFGWLYCDPSYGVGSRMNGDEESRLYYFGNLDQERMTANSDYEPVFEIEKKYFSIDPCDNQLGEIETEERGLQGFEREYEIVREDND